MPPPPLHCRGRWLATWLSWTPLRCRPWHLQPLLGQMCLKPLARGGSRLRSQLIWMRQVSRTMAAHPGKRARLQQPGSRRAAACKGQGSLQTKRAACMVTNPRRELWSRALQKVSTNVSDASRMLWMCPMTGALKLEKSGLSCRMIRHTPIVPLHHACRDCQAVLQPCSDKSCQGAKAPDMPLPCGQELKQER